MATEGLRVFQKATKQVAYLKVGIQGFAGSGKTFTACQMALGIMARIKSKKPVAFIDTETGSDFMLPKFQKAGVELVVSKKRAFKDLLDAVTEAERHCAILIVDSISHIWSELLSAYLKRKEKTRLSFPDWGVIKPTWAEFTDRYVNSQLHIILCGRAAWEYEMLDHGTDVRSDERFEIIKTGTKMRAETDMGYEPNLLLEMERVKGATDAARKGNGKRGAQKAVKMGSGWTHRCHVLKDRTDMINGHAFDNPTFDVFAPVFDYLSIGGTHVGVEPSSSEAMFDPSGRPDWQVERRQKEITLEEIQADLTLAFPSTSVTDKAMKLIICEKVFNTKSWERVTDLPLNRLLDGLTFIKTILSDPEQLERLQTEAASRKANGGPKA